MTDFWRFLPCGRQVENILLPNCGRPCSTGCMASGKLTVETKLDSNGNTLTAMKATKSSWIERLVYLDGRPFSFAGREYLLSIYNSNHPKKLLICGRQVEKCQHVDAPVSLASGIEVPISSLLAGDIVIGFSDQGKQEATKVIQSVTNGKKPCLKIQTRLGSTLIVTHNHPLRKLLEWVPAQELNKFDKIASLRTIGKFGTKKNPLAAMVGLLLGDGCLCGSTENYGRVGFTKENVAVRNWFKSFIPLAGYPETLKEYQKNNSGTYNHTFKVSPDFLAWLTSTGLWGTRSGTKFIPDECFEYDKESTRELLRGLWATDGHCKNKTKCAVDLVYCSTSERMARQVRLLLRKFGVITTYRTYKPKKGNLAHLIRVITRKSVEAFYNEIGPIPGKPFHVPKVESNSNLDTLPKEIYDVVFKIRDRQSYNPGYSDGRSFSKDLGFRFDRSYCPTYRKIEVVQNLFQDKLLQTILDADTVWDEIVSVENVGDQPTWAIQTESETYTSDFVVQHNSTMLANEIIVSSVVNNYHKALYISPSHLQTRQFSNGKLRPWIEDSPLLSKYYVTSAESSQVFERGFSNGSICFLRSAFLNADRSRGLSANLLTLDECQDLLTSNIPIIEECLSHAEEPKEIISGTPKSLDNFLETSWQMSSMCEWLVPCYKHLPTHWNYLDMKTIGKSGLICNKCGSSIHSQQGKWVAFNDKRDLMGYRISQLQVPWFGNQTKWSELLFKLKTYGKAQFHNEVLGISYDSASKPLTRIDLMQCCTSKYPFRHVPDQWTKRLELFAGIDYGEGSDGTELGNKGKVKNASYTILTIGTYIDPKHFHIFFFKRYTGRDALPGNCIADLISTIRAFNVKVVGADWGHGWGVNERLEDALGPRRLIKFQHVGSQKERMKYDDIGHKFQLARNEVMSDMILNIKDCKIVFPAWESVKEFLEDYEHIYSEYNEYSRTLRFDHKASEPDDAFHASLYCLEAANNYYQRTL